MARPPKLPSGMIQRGSVYYAAFRTNGRMVKRKLSANFRAACEILTALRARADRADFDLTDNDLPIVDLRRDYRRHAEQSLRPRSARRALQNVASVLDGGKRKGKAGKVVATWTGITAMKVSQLTAARVLEWRANRLATGSAPRTVNMEVGAVSTMLNWAKRHKQLASNPLAEVSPLPEDDRRKVRRALTVEEVQAIFTAAPGYLLPALRMFATTGIRRDELVEMRFEDVDFEQAAATVRGATAKNHQAREIPLDVDMLATIRRLETEAKARLDVESVAGEHVFTTGAGTPFRNNLLRAFYRVCKKAGIRGAERRGSVDLHSLRATFATLAIDHGASPRAIQAILGHATLGMTMSVYAKSTERAKRDAISALPFATAATPAGVVSGPNVPSVFPGKKTRPQTATA